MSECNEPVYDLPVVTEIPKSRGSIKGISRSPNLTDKTIPASDLIEKTETSDRKKTEYQKINVPYRKAKPQRTIIMAKII